MRTHGEATERDDLVGWSTPLIADCLGVAYRACLGEDEPIVDYFAKQHGRVWLCAVGGDPFQATESQRTLGALAKLCRLSDEALDTIDNLVMDELAEVVSRRYQGSPAKTRAYNRILIDAASVMTRTRLAA